MSRVYQNLGLPPEASALTVVRTAIRRLHPDTLAVRSWREARWTCTGFVPVRCSC